MKIKVEFIGIPMVSRAVGGKSVDLDFPGRTVGELVGHITGLYGKKVHDFLLDESGKLDMCFQVLLNGKEWIGRDGLNRTLKDKDHVLIMMLAAGG